MDCKKIGNFIYNKRKNNKMTQKELADKLGVTDKAISKWERGLGCPDISLVSDLSKILNVTINELLSGQNIEKFTTEKADQITLKSIELYTNIEKTKNKKLILYIGMFSLIILSLIIFIVALMVANAHLYIILIGIFLLCTSCIFLIKLQDNKEAERYIWFFLFALYLSLLTISSIGTFLLNHSIGITEYTEFNIIPLKSIFETITTVTSGAQNFSYIFDYIITKMIIMIPLPILFNKITKKKFTIKKIIVIGFIISLFKECIQYFTKMGIFNIDDLILNIIGCIIGYIIMIILKKIYWKNIK